LRPLIPLQALVAVLLLVSGGASQTFNQHCNDDMTACSCPKADEVCRFEFSVERLITFTRYVRDTPLGSAGKSYFINDTGELEHIPLSPDQTGCNATNCTQANTADGATYRTFIGINGRLPGPTLVVYEGQTVVVNVINTLATEPITMHWHGLVQFNTPWMDGAEIITQCPIAPGTSFRYIFKASQAGTFWYHSHSGFQRGDGLAGGLVVKDSSDPEYPFNFTDIPEEHTVTLLDWQRQIGTALFWKGLSKLRRFSPLNEPFDSVPVDESSFISTQGADNSGVGIIPFWSVLINGMGKHSDLDFKNSRLKVFSVEVDQTYRFRLIGMMGVYALRFSIDGHRLTVIATDGNYIQPVETDYVILHSGERYDVLVTANQTGQSDFWIRAETLEVNTSSELPPYEPLPGHEGLAVLHYRESAPIPVGPEYANIMEVPKNCSEAYECTAVNCPFMMYHSSYHIKCINVHELMLKFPFPPDLLPSAEPDIEYVLNFAFEGTRKIFSINARAFYLPVTSPQIFPDKIDTASVCDPSDTCEDGCLCTNILDVPYNKTVRLVLSSGGLSGKQRKFAHPIHLHGHDFQVVAVGYGKYNDTTGHVIEPTENIICAPRSTKSVCVNPSWSDIAPSLPPVNEYTIAKDTVILPALGYVVIEFRSTNPGWWFMHCHMWPHVAEGMALVVNEAPERSPPPPKGICDPGNFTWTVEEFNKALNYTYTPPSPMPSTSTTIAPTTMTTQSTGSTAALSRADEDCDMLKDAFVGVATVLILFLIVSVTLQSVVIVILTRKNACRKPKNSEEKLQDTTVTNVSFSLRKCSF
jgi:FtsP/CotA-like multicopper oxidase with cupredoxin domain